MRLFTLILVCFCAHLPAAAQVVRIDSTSHWKKAFKSGINLNQASFTSNWKAGGVNSVGFNTLLNYKAGYKHGVHSWDSEIDLLFGMVNNQGQGARKTMDRIFLDTRYGRAINSHWDWVLATNLQSQFAKGYKYSTDSTGMSERSLISDFFAPAFITASVGFEYHPVDYFKLRLSPLAPRVTIVNDPQRFVTADNPTPYGVNPSRATRFEWLAFQMLAEYNRDIAKNMNLKWRYVMFADYKTLVGKKIDHRLDLTLVAKVNRFVNVNLSGILLYDYDQGTRVQLSEAFSLGVLYTFQNYEEKKIEFVCGKMEIRICQTDDLAKLRELAIESFEETFAPHNTAANMQTFLMEAYSPEAFMRDLSEEGARCWIGWEQQEAVGFARVRINDEAAHHLGTHTLELQRLYVLPSRKGQRIGSQLLNMAVNHAQALRMDWLWLGVWEHNTSAQKFYFSHGFERFGEHIFQMGDDPQIDWLLRKRVTAPDCDHFTLKED